MGSSGFRTIGERKIYQYIDRSLHLMIPPFFHLDQVGGHPDRELPSFTKKTRIICPPPLFVNNFACHSGERIAMTSCLASPMLAVACLRPLANYEVETIEIEHKILLELVRRRRLGDRLKATLCTRPISSLPSLSSPPDGYLCPLFCPSLAMRRVFCKGKRKEGPRKRED